MCVFDPGLNPSFMLEVFLSLMEYPLPGPVIALLQEEKATLAPKSYFISSEKKSIKITLVYSKEGQPNEHRASSSTTQRKKSRHRSSSRQIAKKTSASKRKTSQSLSESSNATNIEYRASSSSAASETDQAFASPDVNGADVEVHTGGRERMSTADSGHPSSSGTIAHGLIESDSDSDVLDDDTGAVGGEEEGGGPGDNDSDSSSDSEKPRTPGRDIAVTASSLGPGETPVRNRDEMWQTWTRIPRASLLTTTSRVHHKFLPNTSAIRSSSSLSSTHPRRSASPGTSGASQRGTISQATLAPRRPRLHEGVSWDGSGNNL